MHPFPNPVDPTFVQTAYYRYLVPGLLFGKPSTVKLLGQMFPGMAVNPHHLGVQRALAGKGNWDGIVFVPSRTAAEVEAPYLMLADDIAVCREVLADLGFVVRTDCVMDPEHYRFIPNAHYASLFEGKKDVLIPAHFSLGAITIGNSTDEVRKVMYRSGMPQAKLIDPGTGLLVLTQFLHAVRTSGDTCHKQIPTLSMECAGAEYSPRGNGEWNDVPRWEVHHSLCGGQSMVYLNWNWTQRGQRPAQGVGLLMDARG